MSIKIPTIQIRKETEKEIEEYLTKRIGRMGGQAYKFSSPQRRAVPDRICVLPNRTVVFIECKRPGLQPTAAQHREIKRLRDWGVPASWVATKAEVDYLVEVLQAKIDTAGFVNFWDLRKDGK